MLYGFNDEDKSKARIDISYDGDSIWLGENGARLTAIKDDHNMAIESLTLDTGYNSINVAFPGQYDPEDIIFTHLVTEGVASNAYAYIVGYNPTIDSQTYKIDGLDLLIYSSKSQSISARIYYLEIGKDGIE